MLLLLLLQVVSLNGVKVSNMEHLVQLVDDCSEEYLHFDLDYNQKVGGWGQQQEGVRVAAQPVGGWGAAAGGVGGGAAWHGGWEEGSSRRGGEVTCT